jgi:hypothetical protein
VGAASGKAAREIDMKKKSFALLAALILVVLMGCPTEPEADTWSDVTSLDQLNGTWKGSLSQTQSIEEYLGGSWQEAWAATYGDMYVTSVQEVTFTIDATAGTMATTTTITITFSGGNIVSQWETIKGYIPSPGSYNFNDTAHSATGSATSPATATTINVFQNIRAQINQNGTKLKATPTQGTEIVYYKQ